MTGDEEQNGSHDEQPLKALSVLLPRGSTPRTLTPHPSPEVQLKYEEYKSGNNCDVIIHVGKDTIAAHSLVLSKSPFFAGELLLHVKKADKIILDLHGVEAAAVRNAIGFLYGEEISVNTENVQGLYVAATKLQLNDIYQVCFEFVSNLLCSSNAIAVYRLAQKEGWEQLRELAWDTSLRNFQHVIQSIGFLEAPKETVLALLSQDRLCLQQGDGSMKPEEHEKAILDAVLRYAEIQGIEEGFLVKLLKAVRLPLINKDALLDLQVKFNQEGWKSAVDVIRQAVVVHRHMSVPNISLNALKWKRPRIAASKLTTLLQYPGLLHGEVFSDDWKDPWIHVVGMKLWVKPSAYFQNKRVITGIKVYYSNGEALEHGSRDPDMTSLYSFQLTEEERIVQVEKCHSCNTLDDTLYNLINKLTFMTNKGHVYGVYVNPCKQPDIYSAPSGVQYSHLSGIKGTYAELNEEKYIDWLAFSWGYC